MWLEQIEGFSKNNKQSLDFKLELHLTIYIMEILNGIIEFSLDKDDISISIKDSDKVLTMEEFFYWWQITRFDEIISEEEIIFNDYNELKEKISKVIEKVKNPEIKDSDSDEDKNKKIKKINNNNEKVNKLSKHLKDEADKSNAKLNSLKNMRTIYPTYESLERFYRNIRIILMNK